MNMKRGGSLDNSTYVLYAIVVLNLIAYLSVKDWMASAVLVLACIAAYTFENKGVVLFVGILAAALSRSVFIEGMTTDKKDSVKEMKEKSKKKLLSFLGQVGVNWWSVSPSRITLYVQVQKYGLP